MDRHRTHITSKTILSDGWGRLTLYDLDYARSDGSRQPLKREVYDHGNGACVLLFDPRAQTLTFVRQYRLPGALNGDEPMMLEVCAGLLDGDGPEECARREAMEETGIAPARVVHAFDLYMSPGSLSEKVHCFVGYYGTGDRPGWGGGLAAEGEDIEVVTLSPQEALAMIRSGAITDAKTVALIQHAALEGLLEAPATG
ncbi:NUDIX domain-containing protein [Pelagibacterium montanilacus]|uniref:NUDIX domain-containing protein n=1 Tax=Pelagibacterium montanilacus TaxID=2185280 RepID=UPI000F8DFEB1|nr:NUDIX domain-containing protein [Pelagibacterium montanilacus]